MTTLTISRRGLEPPVVYPSSLRLTPASFGVERREGIRRGRLWVPSGWKLESPSPLAWFVTPNIAGIDLDAPARMRLELEYDDGSKRSYSRVISIQLDLETTFSPDPHAYPERNSATAIGEVGPEAGPFQETFGWLPAVLGSVLFRGLYSDIVQLRSEGPHRGGLCSGMARWAGLRGLRGEDRLPDRDESIREISTLHGRQLTDRALLSSAEWFLRASPRAAYKTVRDDALRTGKSLRAFDVGVPKPWRRDLPKAIVREGHTIVPYRIRQTSPRRASVDCYDPNRGRETHTIEFHLDTDTYAYRHHVRLEDTNVGLIAVPHEIYGRKGTAILASLGSLFWLLFGPGRR
ncbi:MAG: hypothetical protein R3A46_01940 [Thermomicrobiales bacterium]